MTVHVYRAEEGGYWAEMPEFPGCYTRAETMDDAGYADRHVIERTDEPEVLQVAL